MVEFDPGIFSDANGLALQVALRVPCSLPGEEGLLKLSQQRQERGSSIIFPVAFLYPSRENNRKNQRKAQNASYSIFPFSADYPPKMVCRLHECRSA